MSETCRRRDARLTAAPPSFERRLLVRLLPVLPLALPVLLAGCADNDDRGGHLRHTRSDMERDTMSHGQSEGRGSY